MVNPEISSQGDEEEVPQQQQEQKENEKSPILEVIITRHGPKLSATGEKNKLATYFEDHVKSGYKNMNLTEDKEGLVHIASSSVKRARDTAEIYSNEISKSKHRTKKHISSKEALAVPFQPIAEAKDKRFAEDLNTIVTMQKKIEPKIRDEVEKEYPDSKAENREAEIRNRIDMVVMAELLRDESRNKEEKKFKISAGELSDNFAERYLGFAHHTKLLKKLKNNNDKQPENEPYIQIDVSHSFPIMLFLKKYLIFDDGIKASSLNSHDFFTRTGGIIPESGSLKMDYLAHQGDIENIQVAGEFSPFSNFKGRLDIEHMKKIKDKGRLSAKKFEGSKNLEGFFDGLYEQYNIEHKEFKKIKPQEALSIFARNPNLVIEEVFGKYHEPTWRAALLLALEIMTGAREWCGISEKRLGEEMNKRVVPYGGQCLPPITPANYLYEGGFFEDKQDKNSGEIIAFPTQKLLKWLQENDKK